MNWALAPITLTDDLVKVRTLRAEDIEDIVKSIHDPDGWSGRMWGIDTPEKIREMLEGQLDAYQRGLNHPFVYFVGNEVAGITRYHSFFSSRKAFELGGTCVAPKWRRTFVNTRVKNLLFEYAFEVLGAVRVELRVDCANYVSQMNVLRLGAHFEGIIRHWQVRKNGHVPDGRLYSITNKEWPKVKERMNSLKQNKPIVTDYFPSNLESVDLKLKTFGLSDVTELVAFVTRNKKDLTESFPQLASVDSTSEALSYIAERAHWASDGAAFYYGVRLKKDDQFIGQLIIKRIDWNQRSAELGYYIDGEIRRRGFAKQMLDLAMSQLFDRYNFRRLTVRAMTTNVPSIGLAEKVGFKKEGLLRSEFQTGDGRFVDTFLFSKLNVGQ